MKFSGLLKGYLAFTLAVCVWLASALGMGWRMPLMSMGSGGASRAGGGYFGSFGK